MKTAVVISAEDNRYSSLALLSGTFKEKIKRAADLGFDGVDLMVRDARSLDWFEIKQAVDGMGLRIPQIVTDDLFEVDGLCIVTEDEDVYRQTLARSHEVIDFAAHFGSTVNIGVIRGRIGFLKDVADPWGIALDRLRNILAYAEEKGVTLLLEPLNRYEADFALTAAEAVRIIEDLDCPNLGLMLDTFHMNIEESTLEDSVRLGAHLLQHISLADSNRRYPGSGHIDFNRFFATVLDIHYSGFISAKMLPYPNSEISALKTIEALRIGFE